MSCSLSISGSRTLCYKGSISYIFKLAGTVAAPPYGPHMGVLAGSYLPLAACVGFSFFYIIGLLLNCCGVFIPPPWVKCFTYCIKCIWLKCLYWNILHSTCDKTVQDVKFYEGWPLLGCLLAVFMISLHKGDCKIYILGKDFFRYFEFWYGIWSLGYFGGFLTPYHQAS